MTFTQKTLLATSSLLLSHAAMASSDWWFDVEVLIFDRGQAISQTKEQFKYAQTLAPVGADWDLLDALLRPDISGLKQNMPVCGQTGSPLYAQELSVDEIVATHQRWQQDNNAMLADTEQAPSPDAPALPVTPYATGSLSTPVKNDENDNVPDPWQIAGYWLEFHWPQVSPVTVPDTTYCVEPQPWIAFENNQWQVATPDNALPSPDEVPITPQGAVSPDEDNASIDESGTARILGAQANELTKLSAQVRNTRGLTRLLHTTWRQPVAFGQQEAASVRVFAGKNYAKQFELSGQQRADELITLNFDDKRIDNEVTSEAGFFERLDKQLASNEDVSFAQMMAATEEHTTSLQRQVEKASLGYNTPIWQVDGYIKVYLKNINRVPYLHIDSKMYYRQPVPMTINNIANGAEPQYELVSVPFHQIRRVISKQLHYFDHPLFGMAIKIRRAEVSEER